MRGKSMPIADDVQIKFSELSYLKLTYYGFDGESHNGEMVVNKKVAQDVVDIFKELYEKKFPIEKIQLVDDFNASDEESMKNNNTSAFNYRLISGSSKLSNHSFGFAIDINPVQNPHVVNGKIPSITPEKCANRANSELGMIHKYDACYNAFISRGWSWGGFWKNPDYQHFEFIE
jgi:hypothetical protein